MKQQVEETTGYIVIAENDQIQTFRGVEIYDSKGPIIFETYLKHSTLKDAVSFIKRLNGAYGCCRVAKFEFVEIPASILKKENKNEKTKKENTARQES